jgi:BCD family chlorophyll transporter-like MFS transporter
MHLTWFQIFRLGLVQMALGAIVVLTTSTLNRLMVVEFALPAVLPGALVGLHYGIQMTRPKWGFISDKGGNRTQWIIGGMAVLALGGLLAAYAVTLFAASYALALGLSLLAYAAIGLGVGASGTSLLALLATTTAPHRRAAAATITWLMMIFGIALTAGLAGSFLDPYSPARLMSVVAVVVTAALLLTIIASARIERGLIVATQEQPTPFMEGLREIWAEPRARNFTLFVFLSMNAYFMQELILEPYAGLVFNFTPGQSTQLSGAQNGGVFIGMLTVGIMATGLKRGSLRLWVTAGCLGSAAVLGLIAINGTGAAFAPLTPLVTLLGFFNGMFAVAAIGSMMALASDGRERREGTRMGLWGAAQAIAAGFGGLTGAAAVDILRTTMPDGAAFGAVFTFEAALFVAAALMALRILDRTTARGAPAPNPITVPGE